MTAGNRLGAGLSDGPLRTGKPTRSGSEARFAVKNGSMLSGMFTFRSGPTHAAQGGDDATRRRVRRDGETERGRKQRTTER